MSRFKLDENLNEGWAAPLVDAGHDVQSVRQEGLSGSDDGMAAAACQREDRCLVTADLDFAQIIRYPPEEYSGIVILRHPAPTLRGMSQLMEQLVTALAQMNVSGQLWIVEPGRLRVHDTKRE